MQTRKALASLWNWKDIFIIQCIAILIRGFISACQTFLVPADHFLTPFFTALIYFIGQIILLVLLIFWLTHLYGISLQYFGLTYKNFKSGLLLFLKLALPFLIMLILVINWQLMEEPQGAIFNPLVKINGIEGLIVSLVYFFLWLGIFLLPSLATEILYRGLVSSFMANKWGRIFGGVFNAIYFALLVSPLKASWFLFYVILGIILYHSFQSRQNLWPGILYLSFVQAALVMYVFGINFFQV